jgi:hypothetical protein
MEVLGAALRVAAERCVTKLAQRLSNGACCQQNQTEATARSNCFNDSAGWVSVRNFWRLDSNLSQC